MNRFLVLILLQLVRVFTKAVVNPSTNYQEIGEQGVKNHNKMVNGNLGPAVDINTLSASWIFKTLSNPVNLPNAYDVPWSIPMNSAEPGQVPEPISVPGNFVNQMNMMSAAVQGKGHFDDNLPYTIPQIEVTGLDFTQPPPDDFEPFDDDILYVKCETSDASPQIDPILKLAENLDPNLACPNFNTIGSNCFAVSFFQGTAPADRAVITLCQAPGQYIPCNWITKSAEVLVKKCKAHGQVGGQVMFGPPSQMRVLFHKGNIWS